MKQHLTFGIDIDGVLADIDGVLDSLSLRHVGIPWPHNAPSGILEGVNNISKSFVDVLNEFHMACIPNLRLMPGAKNALEILRSRYRLVLITARWASSETMTRDWLWHHQLPFDALYHVNNKIEVPEDLSVAIDDHPHHILPYLEKNITCFVMDHARNRDLSPHPKLVRVKGWNEVIDHLLPYSSFKTSLVS